MGLRFHGHENMWMDLIGRSSFVTVVITYLVISVIFSGFFMYGLEKLDHVLEHVFTTIFKIDTNQFLQHILSYCGNFLVCVLFFDFVVIAFQSKNATKLESDKMLFKVAIVLFTISVLFSTVSLFVPTSWLAINIFFTITVSVFISWIVNIFAKFSDAIDLKISIATVKKLNDNLRKHGFNTLVFDEDTFGQHNHVNLFT